MARTDLRDQTTARTGGWDETVDSELGQVDESITSLRGGIEP